MKFFVLLVTGTMFILLFLIFLWSYWLDLLKKGVNRECISTYECGFDCKDHSRLPFSLRFFLIVIFFIMLDMEMCLLIQLPYELKMDYFFNRMWFLCFVVLLTVGVIEELRLGLLKWKD